MVGFVWDFEAPVRVPGSDARLGLGMRVPGLGYLGQVREILRLVGTDSLVGHSIPHPRRLR